MIKKKKFVLLTKAPKSLKEVFSFKPLPTRKFKTIKQAKAFAKRNKGWGYY